MSHQDWINLLAPTIAALIVAGGGVLAALATGLFAKIEAYLTAHNQAAAAAAVASANTVIHAALTTGASTIAGKIASGQLDYTNRSAWEAEAAREVTLVERRVPGAIATAQPLAGALIAALMAKVDQQLVASPTPLAGQVSAGPSITAAVRTIADAREALAKVGSSVSIDPAPKPPAAPAIAPEAPAVPVAA